MKLRTLTDQSNPSFRYSRSKHCSLEGRLVERVPRRFCPSERLQPVPHVASVSARVVRAVDGLSSRSSMAVDEADWALIFAQYTLWILRSKGAGSSCALTATSVLPISIFLPLDGHPYSLENFSNRSHYVDD